MRRLTLSAAALVLAAGAAPALWGQQSTIDRPENIRIEEGGEIRIEGTASIMDFTCRARELSGTGAIENTARPTQNIEGEGSVRITISIPVRTLECGKRAMNRDMHEALKSEDHPLIRYRLLQADLVQSTEEGGAVQATGESAGTGTAAENGWLPVRTRGILYIAGQSDTTEVMVRGRLLEGDRFRVQGSKELHMDTFGITPPSALMGLIRADKRLTVHFDVTVRLSGSDG